RITLNRVLLRSPPTAEERSQISPDNLAALPQETPHERQLFLDGVIWHAAYQAVHPEESDTSIQEATLHHFEKRLDIARATHRVLHVDNPNLITGQEWLSRLDRLLQRVETVRKGALVMSMDATIWPFDERRSSTLRESPLFDEFIKLLENGIHVMLITE